MSRRIAISDLPGVLTDYGYEPFVVFNTAEGSPRVLHVSVEVADSGGLVELVARCGRSTVARLADRPEVAFVWPSPSAGAMSLIVDAVGTPIEAEAAVETNPVVRFVAVDAVLHRPASSIGDC